jgi:hypothetical protein
MGNAKAEKTEKKKRTGHGGKGGKGREASDLRKLISHRNLSKSRREKSKFWVS